jgi:hypothetical protein
MHQKFQFSPLIFGANVVADDRRCKAALRTEPQSFHRNVPRGFAHPAPQQLRSFVIRFFCRDEPEHDEFVVRHVIERREGAGAGVVVLQ